VIGGIIIKVSDKSTL